MEFNLHWVVALRRVGVSRRRLVSSGRTPSHTIWRMYSCLGSIQAFKRIVGKRQGT